MLVLHAHRHPQETAVTSMSDALRRLKAELADALPETLVRGACRDLGLAWRRRTLTPVTTTYLLLQQVLHGNTAIAHLRHLSGLDFTDSAYCQARARLPLAVLRGLQRAVAGRLGDDDPAARWRGRRVFWIDGSTFSMPDTAELREAFGQPGAQAAGCGFPVAHLLTLFDAHAGFLLQAIPAPLRTHDLAHAAATHGALAEGDVLVGDRAFASYAHLALCRQRGLHAVFRAHQRRKVRFGRGPGRRRLGRRDQLVEYRKPRERPAWMGEAEYAALPAALTMRELRYDVRLPGRRTRRVTLVTTLLNPRLYPARALAELYGRRWEAETDLRHLKQTLGLGVLRSRTVPGVVKELVAFVIVYNLVRRVMRAAARRQGVAPARVSFVDALRWLRHARPREGLPRLRVNRERPGRAEPRVRKRRPKPYGLMRRPRTELREALFRKRRTA
jgi:hypothetical protein